MSPAIKTQAWMALDGFVLQCVRFTNQESSMLSSGQHPNANGSAAIRLSAITMQKDTAQNIVHKSYNAVYKMRTPVIL